MLRHATTMRAATDDDGSCLQLDECGVCGGTCIPDGACDCEGNVLDECGECAVRASLMVRVTAMATYSTSAVQDEDGSCTYAEEGYDCDGNCLADADGDGVCDEFEIAGCQDATACNYNEDATDEDGICAPTAEEGY